jgi:acyl dehydratase
MNPAVQGKVYPEVPFVVDVARVAAFREVAGQADGVPPTFVTAGEFSVFPAIVGDPELELDFTRVVHGTQEYVFARPLVEGETLVVRAHIESIRERGGNGFLTVVMELLDTDGEVACTARSMMIERAAEER